MPQTLPQCNIVLLYNRYKMWILVTKRRNLRHILDPISVQCFATKIRFSHAQSHMLKLKKRIQVPCYDDLISVRKSISCRSDVFLLQNTFFHKKGIHAFVLQLNEALINSKQVKAVCRKDKQLVAIYSKPGCITGGPRMRSCRQECVARLFTGGPIRCCHFQRICFV